jgi:ADP-ribosyl-[dinitrogen reductase] hydrolase
MMDTVLNGVMGMCVADAMGVPVEFSSRQALQENPMVGMRSHGTHNQPTGTWSDDISMALCLMDSLCNGLDYQDIKRLTDADPAGPFLPATNGSAQ